MLVWLVQLYLPSFYLQTIKSKVRSKHIHNSFKEKSLSIEFLSFYLSTEQHWPLKVTVLCKILILK